MAARLIKLPRSYYKRKTPPPLYRTEDTRYQATFAANFGSIGPGRNAAITDIRKMLLQNLANDILDKSRAVHINYTIDGWNALRAEGFLNEDVAIVVDGSPNRPIRNVKFAGTIQILEPATLQIMMEAAALAWQTMLDYTQKRPYAPNYENKKPKGRAGRWSYKRAFRIFISDKLQIQSPTDVGRMGEQGLFTMEDWVTITNDVPYAAKLERYDLKRPGAFVQAFNAVRRKYGSRVAVRFDFVEGETFVSNGRGGFTPNAQPVLRIGQPGMFPSRKPSIRRLQRNRINQGGSF